VAELARAGCLIAMGSDNMAEDMVEVVRTGLFMERVRRQDGVEPTPEEALAWATRNGYRALGVPDGGWLGPGAWRISSWWTCAGPTWCRCSAWSRASSTRASPATWWG
jgi:hypothetical protein